MSEAETIRHIINLVLQGAIMGITLGFLYAFFGRIEK